uniref:receptor protein-tyrosine kinase n=1 Tax=Scophthalmus maximus TaxID=52904 RepID=A0A8D3EC35_SCOMX
MAVCNSTLWSVTVFLLWTWTWEAGSGTQYQAEEVEIFNSDKRARLMWTSDPRREWTEIQLRLGAQNPVPVLQACGRRMTRTILSHWMEREEAHNLLMDLTFAQEEEPPGQLGPLGVHLFDTDTPIGMFQNRWTVLEIQTSKLIPGTVPPSQISSYLNRSLALSLGSVSRRGFQLAFSYSGTCVFLTSLRLYYRRCPDAVAHLALFGRTGAGSGPLTGACVKGAVEVSLPVRECDSDGVWGPLQGGCTCEPGHQAMDDICQACMMGYYKPANDSAGCRLCPANSRTRREGSERCDCLQGYSRLPTDSVDLSCTKPPSAPVNLTAHHHNNDSALTVTWDPPLDRGGRQEVTYGVKCEKDAETGGQWEACGDNVVFLPGSSGLTSTSVNIAGLNPQCDYRLSVHAWNDVSSMQRAPPASTATVTIHRWKTPSAVITVAPGLNNSEHESTPAPQHHRRFYVWLAVGVLFGSLLLIAVIPIAVCILRGIYTKLRSEQEIELLPMDAELSYRPLQVVEAAQPQQAEGVEGMAQMLEGFSGSLLLSLKEVLVERNKLTLGKELGKGEFGSVYEGIFERDEGVDIRVAVKTMRVGIHSQEDLHEFLREAEIMRHFDHENVVRLLAVTLQREQDSPLPVPLVILPYMKHGDLRRFLIATRYGDIPMAG